MTTGHIAQLGPARGAWFKDPDGNFLASGRTSLDVAEAGSDPLRTSRSSEITLAEPRVLSSKYATGMVGCRERIPAV